jgi:hypothetical protein
MDFLFAETIRCVLAARPSIDSKGSRMRASVQRLARPILFALSAFIAPHAMAIVIGLDIAYPPGPPGSPSSSLSGTAEFWSQPADLSHPPSPCTDPFLVALVAGDVFHADVLYPPGPPACFSNLLFSFGGQELVSSGDSSLILPAFAFLANSEIPPGPPGLPPLLLLGAFEPGLDVSGPIVAFSGSGTEFASFRVTTVPEPGTLALLAISAFGLAVSRCKR